MIEGKIEEYTLEKKRKVIEEMEAIDREYKILDEQYANKYKEIVELKHQLGVFNENGIRFKVEKLLNTKNYVNMQRARIQIKKLEDELFNINLKRHEIGTRKNDCDLDYDLKIENIENENNYMKNNHNEAIKILLKNKPELATNLDFMSEAIDIDIFSISKDKSNDIELYKKYLSKISDMAIENDDNDNVNEESIDLIDKILMEFEKPKIPEEGKYKISHEYIFEAIRINAEYCEKNNITDISSLLGKKDLGENSVNSLKSYIENDCKLQEKFGKSIEALYNNKKFYIFQHKYKDKNLKNEIFENGIAELDNKKRELKYVATGNMNGTMCFLDLIDCNNETDKIICALPKKISKNWMNISIWGEDEKNVRSYILPEYIIGNIDGDGNFEKNTIPRIKRKKYKYHYKDSTGGKSFNNSLSRTDKLFTEIESEL